MLGFYGPALFLSCSNGLNRRFEDMDILINNKAFIIKRSIQNAAAVDLLYNIHCKLGCNFMHSHVKGFSH